jgi:hypothetical protein
MHLVQSVFRTISPFSITLMRWILGLNLRREERSEKLRVFPNIGFLPQFWQTAMLNRLYNPVLSDNMMVYAITAQGERQGRSHRHAFIG